VTGSPTSVVPSVPFTFDLPDLDLPTLVEVVEEGTGEVEGRAAAAAGAGVPRGSRSLACCGSLRS
jgi:hypothetical protein